MSGKPDDNADVAVAWLFSILAAFGAYWQGWNPFFSLLISLLL